MKPALRPFRLVTHRLAVPGVIGVRNPHSLSFGRGVHVLVGPDAGFPEHQPLDEWKSDVSLVDARALPAELREEAGLRLPEEARAEREALDRAYAEALGVGKLHTYGDGELEELALDERARLTLISERACRVLEAHGHPYWVAGYSRVTSLLWVHRIGGAAPFRAWTGSWDKVLDGSPPEVPPDWMGRELYFELERARWADRALRALSGGEVTEPALLREARRESFPRFEEDDVLQQALEVAARMTAGADEVLIPLHGPARRVRLPAFTMRVYETDPFDRNPLEPRPMRDVEVPAEDAWVLTARS
ncbi:hypothetical protein HPC49_46775 [Pyxidicoccus fallax]|uniref:hypothetical protein n=1 Tax=Pyxidicoccus fallax TaxID=394095 RepID=UPI001494E284|nr:hypothetical protein [Pyxidicoccus fallax]NPC85682.1 hypothetical protein [Pyxidicoccus fallax]